MKIKLLELYAPRKFTSVTLPYAKVNKNKLNNIQFNEASEANEANEVLISIL